MVLAIMGGGGNGFGVHGMRGDLALVQGLTEAAFEVGWDELYTPGVLGTIMRQ